MELLIQLILRVINIYLKNYMEKGMIFFSPAIIDN